jgi:hypothetical protein
MFGRHHDSKYGFLEFHVFRAPTIPKTMWLMFVGELGVVVVGYVEVDKRRLKGW